MTTGPSSSPIALLDAPAPLFEARSTQGPVRLSDYRGKWLVFFSHPADFTPVCTTEFMAFQNRANEFEALDCDLLGLSVDSVFAHLAWIRDIENRFGVDIQFPILEDVSMGIARAYGMIHETSASTATVRATFIIDPEGVVRATLHYPMNVGRSVDEILRLLKALQLGDREAVATPEGWQPGEATVMPPPVTGQEIAARSCHGDANRDWYFTEVREDKAHA